MEKQQRAITSFLQAYGGFPVADSVIEKGVLQYSIRWCVGREDARQAHARTQKNILKGRADQYGNTYSFFEEAISVLDDEEAMKTHDTNKVPKGYSYREICRWLSVLKRQQWAPREVLGRMWKIESREVIGEICEDLFSCWPCTMRRLRYRLTIHWRRHTGYIDSWSTTCFCSRKNEEERWNGVMAQKNCRRIRQSELRQEEWR